MEILKFGDNPSPNRSNNNQRKPAAMIVAGVLVAMMGMSTTLAGTISIGTNSRVEFGQGVVATAAINTSGLSIYDGTDLSASSADVTFYIDSTRQINIDGQGVGRTTVETVNNPSAS